MVKANDCGCLPKSFNSLYSHFLDRHGMRWAPLLCWDRIEADGDEMKRNCKLDVIVGFSWSFKKYTKTLDRQQRSSCYAKSPRKG